MPTLVRSLPATLRHWLRPLLDPYRRYRLARYLHAARVMAGLVATIALSLYFDLPHGEWVSVTMLIVVGGLQHQGNIRRKALERAYGTLIGAGLGLLVVAQQMYVGQPILTYGLMALFGGFFAYHAIGKGGYTALLSAITLFIVAGHGFNPLTDGLWRTVGIGIGIVMALVISFAFPLYAVFSWRFGLAAGLLDCAKLHGRILHGQSVTSDEHRRLSASAMRTLLQLRGLLPWVAKEVKISTSGLEFLQGHLRTCLSSLEMLANLRPAGLDEQTLLSLQQALSGEHRQIRRHLISMARALRTGKIERLQRPLPAVIPSSVELPASLAGYAMMTRYLTTSLDEFHSALAACAERWNI